MADVKALGARSAVRMSLVVGALAVVVAPAIAQTIGIVPPHRPKHNCEHSAYASYASTVATIDHCRAKEGVGPMLLPNNWRSLTIRERLLVVIDLERVNRGLPPIVGLSRTLNEQAERGARADSDPSFPSHSGGAVGGGSIWAGANTVFEADFGWMYEDGWGAVHENIDCTGPHASGCWSHRDNILLDHVPTIVGGAGYATAKHTRKPYDSYAFEMLAGYSTKGLMFTWASELKHFKKAPGLEPLHKK